MRTVLLVDDSPLVRRLLSKRLVAEGFAVREEGTAAKARALDPAGLVCAVVDLELADGDGPDLAAVLLARKPTLPLAFFTATASSALVERARAHGPVFAKSKPTDVDSIVEWVKRAAQRG
jgi:two-component system response regulator RegA